MEAPPRRSSKPDGSVTFFHHNGHHQACIMAVRRRVARGAKTTKRCAVFLFRWNLKPTNLTVCVCLCTVASTDFSHHGFGSLQNPEATSAKPVGHFEHQFISVAEGTL